MVKTLDSFAHFSFIILFYKIPADIISEEVILKWYKEAHSSKGKIMFLQQMKPFIEWLQNAEEGNAIIYLISCQIQRNN